MQREEEMALSQLPLLSVHVCTVQRLFRRAEHDVTRVLGTGPAMRRSVESRDFGPNSPDASRGASPHAPDGRLLCLSCRIRLRTG